MRLAVKFVENGISVIVVGRRKDKLNDFVKQYGNADQQTTVDSAILDITDLSSILFGNDLATFLMLAIVPITVCTATIFFLRKSLVGMARVEDEIETKYFHAINKMVVVIAVYLLIYDLIGDHGAAMSYVFVIILILLVALAVVPICIPCHDGGDREEEERVDDREGIHDMGGGKVITNSMDLVDGNRVET